MADLLLPDLAAHWRVVRNLEDAILECVDHAIEILEDEYDLGEDEDARSELADRLFKLATERTPDVPS